MAKRKVGNQIVNLIPDHSKSEIDLISLNAGDVSHIIGNFLMRAVTLLQTSFQNYGPKSWESQLWEFRDF
jgi:hypothetical protein